MPSDSTEPTRKRAVSWSGLLETAAVIGWLVTLAGFLGSWSWFLELASHFRVQLAIAFALLTLVTLVGRPRRIPFRPG